MACDLHVLVFEAAEAISSEWPNGRCAKTGECGPTGPAARTSVRGNPRACPHSA